MTIIYGGRESSTRCKHLQIKETTSSILQCTRCKWSQHNQKKKPLQIEKNTCKLRKHFLQFDNTHCKCSQHNQKKKCTAK